MIEQSRQVTCAMSHHQELQETADRETNSITIAATKHQMQEEAVKPAVVNGKLHIQKEVSLENTSLNQS